MKSIYTRNMCIGFLKNKKKVMVVWILITILFVGLGYMKAYPEKLTGSVSDDVKEYNAALEKYDETIDEIQQNIDLCQKQVEQQKKYCDESIYMQLDPSNVQKAVAQYVIETPNMNDSDEQSYIANAFLTYITDSGISNEIANDLGLSSEYLNELISCQVSGNILKVTVVHSDMEQAKKIREKLEEKIDEYHKVLTTTIGEFSISLVNTSEAVVADISIQDRQNANLNNLRGYRSLLTDHKTKLVSQKNSKKSYIEQYKPSDVITTSPKKLMIEYGGLGIIAGIVLPFVVYALWYTMSGRVKGKEELLAADVNVLATYNEKKGYEPSIARTAIDLKLLAEKNDKAKLWMKCLGSSKNISKVTDELKEDISKQGLTMEILEDGKETIDQLQDIVKNGNIILVAEAGTTNYTQVEEQLQFCERFNVSVWGCIVIE